MTVVGEWDYLKLESICGGGWRVDVIEVRNH